MKFRIRRTSDWSSNKSPHPKAEKLKSATSRLYFETVSHTVARNIYTIEINSLDELLKLVAEEGEIIISEENILENELAPYHFEIEIYDDYRE